MKAVSGLEKNIVTFGKDSSCDFYPENITRENGLLTRFDAMKKGEKLGTITLHVAGIHNVLNALAAVAVADYLGIDFTAVQKGLEEFRGAKRRFEKLGFEKGVTVVDDYAHHPTELEATLRAAMEMNFNHVWAIFQPFTFSRTKILLDDFARVLQIPDKAVLTDIMGSREKNTYGIFTRHLAEKIPGCIWFPQNEDEEWTDERKYANFQQICDYVCENVQEGDLVITLGCGDAYKIARMILKKLSEEV
jgi:UDP-N-acetylmuramate--alanine ligase